MADREKLALVLRLAKMEANYEGSMSEDVERYLVAHGITDVYNPPDEHQNLWQVGVGLGEWTKAWPTEPGWYWFWRPDWGTRVEAARVRLSGNGSPIYIRANSFLSEDQYPDAMWHSMSAPHPEPPKESA